MFKVGDKVVNEVFGEGEIVYGPYEGDCYFFKDADGLHHTVSEAFCEPVPKFEAGQVVQVSNLLGRIVAGPYVWRSTKNPFYVVESPEGQHLTPLEEDISPVVE